MKKILSILLTAICLTSNAQKKDSMHFTPMMVRSLGVTFQQFDGLNNRIIAGFPQYNALKDHIWTISAGSMNVMKNFISGLSITAGSSLSGHHDRKSSALRILSGGIDFGYDVIPSDKIMLFPLVGIGAETYHAIFYKDNSSVDFNDVLQFPTVQNSIRRVKFTNSFVTYRLGLGVALKSSGSHAGFIGIQGGYTGSFKNGRPWKSDEDQDLANAPEDKISRFSVALIFGGAHSGRMMR